MTNSTAMLNSCSRLYFDIAREVVVVAAAAGIEVAAAADCYMALNIDLLVDCAQT